MSLQKVTECLKHAQVKERIKKETEIQIEGERAELEAERKR